MLQCEYSPLAKEKVVTVPANATCQHDKEERETKAQESYENKERKEEEKKKDGVLR